MPDHFHDGQAEVWSDNDALDVIACAGTQGGKTECDAHWLLREIQRTAKYSDHLPTKRAVYLFVGPTLKLLESQAIPSFESVFVDEHKLGRLTMGGKPRFVFSEDGARRLCGHPYRIEVIFGYANDSSNIESVTALGGVWDEAGQKENRLSSYRAFNRRLKLARSLGKELGIPLGRRLFTTTPYEWGWFKDQVVDRAQLGHKGFAFYNWPSWFNPLVDEQECRAELEKMPLEEWQMMYLGLFTQPRGKIYDCWDITRNQCKRFDIPDNWDRYIGMDFGSNNTAAVHLAVEKDSNGRNTKRAYLYRTYHAGGKTVPEHKAAITQGLLVRPVCAGGSHMEDEARQAYNAYGLWVREPYVNDVEAQIALVYAAIKQGYLVVFDDLSQMLSEITQYARELDDSGNPTDTIKDKAKWHRLDALRSIATVLWPAGEAIQGRGQASRYRDDLARVV